jgi:hypothetical protein
MWYLHHFQDSGFLCLGLVCLGLFCPGLFCLGLFCLGLVCSGKLHNANNDLVGDKTPPCPSKMAAKSSDLLKLLAPTFLTLEY